MKLIRLAWRNLWRNKRRTAITTASILFAVFFALLMRSFQLGFYDHMITNSIESFSGFIQVYHEDYQDDRSYDNSFVCSDSLLQSIQELDIVEAVVPRVEAVSLASTGEQTKAVMIFGIDPEKERELMNPEHKLVRYRFSRDVVKELTDSEQIPEEVKARIEIHANRSYTSLGSMAIELELDEQDDKKLLDLLARKTAFESGYFTDGTGVLVADRLAKFLQIEKGDTLILLGQGYKGATAAGLYPVRGVVKIPNPELDNKLVFMPIKEAQRLVNFNNRVTTLAINLTDNSEESMIAGQEEIRQKLNNDMLVVKNWKEFNKVVAQQIESDNQSGKAFLGLLYFIIFFGIFGTVLMMIHERYREFGVLVAVGMQKTKLAAILVYEMILMGILGVLSGIVFSLPFLYYLHNNPIRLSGQMAQTMEDMGFEPVMPLAWIDTYVLWQGLIVALMVVLSCLYPLRKVIAMKAINAIRS